MNILTIATDIKKCSCGVIRFLHISLLQFSTKSDKNYLKINFEYIN